MISARMVQGRYAKQRSKDMNNNDIVNCLDLLHKRILHNSKFAEEVTEAEVLALVSAISLIKHQKSDIEKVKE